MTAPCNRLANLRSCSATPSATHSLFYTCFTFPFLAYFRMSKYLPMAIMVISSLLKRSPKHPSPLDRIGEHMCHSSTRWGTSRGTRNPLTACLEDVPGVGRRFDPYSPQSRRAVAAKSVGKSVSLWYLHYRFSSRKLAWRWDAFFFSAKSAKYLLIQTFFSPISCERRITKIDTGCSESI